MRFINTDLLSGTSRDPCCFIFKNDVVLYRQVNITHRENNDTLIAAIFYENFRDENRFLSHVIFDKEVTTCH